MRSIPLPTVELPIAKIRLNGGTQMRAEIDQDVIQDYSEILEQLPPVVVFEDEGTYWLADGFHRLKAALFAGRDRIRCEVRKGTRRDAVLFAVGANATHGLRRSNGDRRKAVMALLTDKQWARWSNRQIARQCQVSCALVSVLRQAVEGPEPDPNRKRLALRGDKVLSQRVEHAQPDRPPANGQAALGNGKAETVQCPHCGKSFLLSPGHASV